MDAPKKSISKFTLLFTTWGKAKNNNGQDEIDEHLMQAITKVCHVDRVSTQFAWPYEHNNKAMKAMKATKTSMKGMKAMKAMKTSTKAMKAMKTLKAMKAMKVVPKAMKVMPEAMKPMKAMKK